MKALLISAFSLSLWGSAAVLAVWLVCALLRRAHAPARLLRLLWLVPAVRFLCPFGLAVTLPRPHNANLAAAAEAVTRYTPPALNAPAANTPLQPPAPATAFANAEAAARAPGGFPLDIWLVLALVWLAGVAFLGVRGLVAGWRLHHRLALACKTVDGAYTCPEVATPFTLGLVRPRIYLPTCLTGPARAAVLLHERSHIRQGDTLLKPIYYAVACLHWWNPLAWLAFRQFSREMEAACDETAIRHATPAGRAGYCESLYRFATGDTVAHVPGALAFGDGQLKGRITRILQYQKPAAGLVALCAAVVALTCAACMARPTLADNVEASPAPTVTAESARSDTEEQVATPANESQPDAASAPPDETDDTLPTDATTAEPFSAESFRCPVAYRYISRYMDNGHNGDDLVADAGTPVYAAGAGLVTTADNHYSFGNYVIIDHGTDTDGNTWQTLYAHMESLTVQTGDRVAVGQQIGTVGSTGNTTDNKLHLELHKNQKRIAPSTVIDYAGGAASPSAEGTVQPSSFLSGANAFDSHIRTLSASSNPALTTDPNFICPLESYQYISCQYGNNGHPGVDLAAAKETPILAVADGQVLEAGYDTQYGNYVVIDHGIDENGDRFSALYTTMADASTVSDGDTVKQGDVLGYVGSTGNSTGNHLHLELRVNDTRVDPLSYISC